MKIVSKRRGWDGERQGLTELVQHSASNAGIFTITVFTAFVFFICLALFAVWVYSIMAETWDTDGIILFILSWMFVIWSTSFAAFVANDIEVQRRKAKED